MLPCQVRTLFCTHLNILTFLVHHVWLHMCTLLTFPFPVFAIALPANIMRVKLQNVAFHRFLLFQLECIQLVAGAIFPFPLQK